MILTNILQRKKYGAVQTVSMIAHDFLLLAIKVQLTPKIFFHLIKSP